MILKEEINNGKIQHELFFDLMVSNKQRYKILINMDEHNQYENVKRLMDIYRINRIKKIEKFFIYLCIFDDKINLYIKQEILFILSYKLTLKNKLGIKRSFSNVLFLLLKKAFISEEYWLMFENHLINYNKLFKVKNNFNLFKNIFIISFKELKCKEPIKKIIFLLMHLKEEEFFMDLCTFIFTKYNHIFTVKNNLLFLQIIFEKENKFKDKLFHIINNKDVDLNLKLEACDILYLKGSKNIQNKVESILKNILPDLAYINNPENVHLPSMVTSIDKTLSSILKLNKGKEVPINLHQSLLKQFSNNIKVKGSLNRIFNYNFLKFSRYNLTLKEILENIWLIISSCDSDLKTQLYIRLEQELDDMYDTCSQGYVTRLINIFSGFQINGDNTLGIVISFEDEIYAIFSNKINNMVSNAPEPMKTKLLEELMVPSDDYENRLNLIRYLRPFLPKIWNEIFEIFKDQLTITDLDLYCRKVMMKYEGY